MAWKVTLKPSANEDLKWFGRKIDRLLRETADNLLRSNPLAETRNMKTLRPNLLAQRELLLAGKYRVLFNVDEEAEKVTIVVVGEKRGNALLVQE
jgi:mRNA-degrading endonuclease RelE of RelBE toxin-antitoxin system